jgi:hypothetical protein
MDFNKSAGVDADIQNIAAVPMKSRSLDTIPNELRR